MIEYFGVLLFDITITLIMKRCSCDNLYVLISAGAGIPNNLQWALFYEIMWWQIVFATFEANDYICAFLSNNNKKQQWLALIKSHNCILQIHKVNNEPCVLCSSSLVSSFTLKAWCMYESCS